MENLPKTLTAHHEKHMPELDGLRGIAIFMVLLWHCFVEIFSPKLAPAVIHKLLGLTWSGVDLFFVLSGFLLGGILIDNKNSTNMFRVFYFRRCCRIFPIYFLWILIFVVVAYVIKEAAYEQPYISIFDNSIYHNIGLKNYLTFTQNFAMAFNHDWGNEWFGSTWSLAVEEQFYLVLPLIIYFFSRRILPFVLIFLIILAPILRTVLFFKLPLPDGPFYDFFLMPCRADSLLLGVLCALGLRNNAVKGFIHRQILTVYLIAGILLGILFIMDFRGEGVCTGYMSWFGYSFLGLFYSCLLIIAVTEKRGFVTAIVRNTWLCKLGIISYGVYIFHEAIMALVHAYFFHDQPQITQWSNGLATIFALFLILLIAWISWNFFEKPIVHFGHMWVYNKRNDKMN